MCAVCLIYSQTYWACVYPPQIYIKAKEIDLSISTLLKLLPLYALLIPYSLKIVLNNCEQILIPTDISFYSGTIPNHARLQCIFVRYLKII